MSQPGSPSQARPEPQGPRSFHTEPSLPWGVRAGHSLPATSGITFQKLILRDKLGPGEPYLCVLVLGRWGKERGRRRRRGGGSGQARL